jgi:signal transduction histidine kinase
MGIRAKLFLIFFACGILPMLVFTIYNYWTSMGTVEALLRDGLEQDSRGIVEDVRATLDEREIGMVELASAPALSEYVAGGGAPRQVAFALSGLEHASDSRGAQGESQGEADTVPETLRAFFESNRKYYAALACLDTKGQPLLRLEEERDAEGHYQLRSQTRDFLPGSASPDERVWSASEGVILRSSPARTPVGTLVRYTIPVFTDNGGGGKPRGALLLDLKLDAILREAARGRAARWSNLARPNEAGLASHLVVALGQDGRVVYHTNEVLNNQPLTSVMPFFLKVGEAMESGRDGSQFYDAPDGDRWLAIYRPLQPLPLSVAVASDESLALAAVRRAGLTSLLLSALIGLLAALLLAHVASRTARSIERVTEGAVAIARGKLDQRIEVRSSDETRLLADTFNQMTERLREQMQRETEMQQFQAFMRISAMLTHDLKNSITALSMLVNNMERQFDNEEFRQDAMQSLREATDKLRRLVAKLSNPVETLSGEYKRPRPHDLVPIIRRVLNATAEPVRSLHEIEVRLPPELVAPVDAERIEKVVENLVINAVEAMGARKGKLTVEAGPVAEGEEVFFSVADTGPGMSEEFQRTRLFRPFKTTKSKGVGLGLYTCREVVNAHGGRIEVESQKGVGSCFRVVLPSVQKIIGPGEKSARQSPGPII